MTKLAEGFLRHDLLLKKFKDNGITDHTTGQNILEPSTEQIEL